MNERRRSLRRELHLPVVVRGHSHQGPWEETTTTIDVSQGGLSIKVNRPVPMGQVLLLTVPLPELFRRHDLKAQAYNVYTLVRYATSTGPPYRLGVMYLGKNPPRGYQENPAALLYMPTDPRRSVEHRVHPRHPVMVTMRLRRVEEPPGQPLEELTITEDLSLGGVRLRCSLPAVRRELVLLTELEGPFRAQAMVINVVHGSDNITRLNLQFTNPEEAAAAARDLLRRQGVSAE